MGAHIFLVGEANYEVCLRHGVYGCVLPCSECKKAEVIAGILSIQPDDLVFFYVKNKGVYGLWKVIGEPFYDDTRLWAHETQVFPYRFSFEPVVGFFEKAISLSDILDLRDKGRVWTFDLNPVQQKNQYKITMDEARELLRLLLRNNPVRRKPQEIIQPYKPRSPREISVDLSGSKAGRVQYEGWLNAFFMRSFAKGELKDILGDYREFLNLVPTTFNKVMDVFLTHVTTVDSLEIPHKYTCMELKADRATEVDLTQILRYEDWLARRVAAGDHDMVQSVLVASRFTDGVIDYVSKRQRIEEKTVRVIQYTVGPENQDILLREVAV